jgi:hypothetical protein
LLTPSSAPAIASNGGALFSSSSLMAAAAHSAGQAINMNDVDQRMEFLEKRYHDLHREKRLVRQDLDATGVDAPTRRALKVGLDEADREQRAILQEIETIENHLLDDIDAERAGRQT